MRIILALTTVGLLASTAAQAVPTITFTAGPKSTFKLPDGRTLASEDFSGGDPSVTGHSQHGCSPIVSGPTSKNVLARGLPSDGGSVNAPAGNFFAAGANYVFDNASVLNRRRNPQADGSCYLSVAPDDTPVGDSSNAANSSYLVLDLNGTKADPLSYVGFLWGSTDNYNYVQFFNTEAANLGDISSSGDPSQAAIALPGADGQGRLFGSALAALGGPAVNTGANTFINFQFTAADAAVTMVLGNTNNYAFELTNLSAATQTDGTLTNAAVPVTFPGAGANALRALSPAPVPEAASAAVLLAGMGLLGFARRKRS